MTLTPSSQIQKADQYSKLLDRLETNSVLYLLAILRRSLSNILSDLRRNYVLYTSTDLPARYRAIIRDAQSFMPQPELEQWRVAFEADLKRAITLGYQVSSTPQTMGTVDFTVVHSAALNAATYIEGETTRFRSQLIEIIGEAVIRGWGPKKIEKSILTLLKGVKGKQQGLEQRAANIARAEMANVYAKASLMQARQRGDLYVRILAANDEHVCPVCVSRNARIYPVNQISLPFHPRCRCIAVTISNEAVEEPDPQQRAILLDNTRWQAAHQKGVAAFAKAKSISIPEAQKYLQKSLLIPTFYEKLLYPSSPALQEVVPLY